MEARPQASTTHRPSKRRHTLPMQRHMQTPCRTTVQRRTRLHNRTQPKLSSPRPQEAPRTRRNRQPRKPSSHLLQVQRRRRRTPRKRPHARQQATDSTEHQVLAKPHRPAHNDSRRRTATSQSTPTTPRGYTPPPPTGSHPRHSEISPRRSVSTFFPHEYASPRVKAGSTGGASCRCLKRLRRALLRG